jgi:hypothetical protein
VLERASESMSAGDDLDCDAICHHAKPRDARFWNADVVCTMILHSHRDKLASFPCNRYDPDRGVLSPTIDWCKHRS